MGVIAILTCFLSGVQDPSFEYPVFVSIGDTPWSLESLGKRIEKQYGIPGTDFLFSLAVVVPRPNGRTQPYKSARGSVFTPAGQFAGNYIQIPRGVKPESFMREWIAVANGQSDPAVVEITRFGSRYVATAPLKDDPLRKTSKSEAFLDRNIFWSGADFNPNKRFPRVPAAVLRKEGLAVWFDVTKAVKSKTGASVLKTTMSSLDIAQQRRDQETDGEYGARHIFTEIGREAARTLPTANALEVRFSLPEKANADPSLLLAARGMRGSGGGRRSTVLRTWCDRKKALIASHCLIAVPRKSIAMLAQQEVGVGESTPERVRNLILTFAKAHGCIDVAVRLEEVDGALIASGAIGTGMEDEPAMRALKQQFSMAQSATNSVETVIDGIHFAASHRRGCMWFAGAIDRTAALGKLEEVLGQTLTTKKLHSPSFTAYLDATNSDLLSARSVGKLLPELTSSDLKATSFSQLTSELDLSFEDGELRIVASASDEVLKLLTLVAFRRLVSRSK